MKKIKNIIAIMLFFAITAGFLGESIIITKAAMPQMGVYKTKDMKIIISDNDSPGEYDNPVTYKNKEYNRYAKKHITIKDEYGSGYMGFESVPCYKKGKKVMIAWSGGSGVGGGQTCWAIITRKSSKKIQVKVYWQSNMDALKNGTKPECILNKNFKK